MSLRIGGVVAVFVLTLAPALAAADGALDTSFGGGTGEVITVLDPASPVNADQAFKVLVQADQKILVVGFGTDIADPSVMAVTRFNPDGSLDHSFGTSGVAKVAFGFLSLNEAFAAALQADGNIVIGGFTSQPAGSPSFALARFRSSGALDPGFGTGGVVQTDLGGHDWILALALQADGKILAAGMTGSITSHDFAVVRYLANGQVDKTFGTAGKVVTDFSGREDRPGAIAVQGDGKIVVAGYSAPSAATSVGSAVALVRYTPAGKLDSTFGSGGKELLHLGSQSAAAALRVLSTGKLLVGGSLFKTTSNENDFMLLRLNSSGTIDTTFGTAGVAVTNFSRTDGIHGLAVLSNGKIVVGGEVEATSFGSGDGAFGLARYTANGQLDETFGTNGKVVTKLGTKGSRCTSLAVQANGRILAAGHVFSTIPGSASAFGIARYVASVPAVQEIGPDDAEELTDPAAELTPP